MREIKFKGYSTEELVNGGQWVIGYGVCELALVEKENPFYILAVDGDYKVYEKSIGQYTGLKDSKGVEIYEGDIVNVNNFGGTPRYEKVGFYTNAGFAGLHPFTDSGHHWSSKNCEIIGNIYENPELLEEQS